MLLMESKEFAIGKNEEFEFVIKNLLEEEIMIYIDNEQLQIEMKEYYIPAF